MRETTEAPLSRPMSVEVVVRLGVDTVIRTDADGDSAPALWLRDGLTELLILPSADEEGRPLRRSDLDRAADLIIAAIAYRNAIYCELTRTGVIPSAQRRRRQPDGLPSAITGEPPLQVQPRHLPVGEG